MFGLIYKELLANKKQFIPILIVTAFASFFIVIPPIVSDMEEWEVNLTEKYGRLSSVPRLTALKNRFPPNTYSIFFFHA